ncbi:MAG: TerB family tellurite resistance protein [Flammeovirgaceae bacterium]|nr:TerB family tellurite resistance protein [Flammeovirgaceae bacterium]
MKTHQSFADFVTFLYMHIAHVDGHFHDNEKDAIIDKMSKLYPNEENIFERFEKAKAEYEKMDPAKMNEFIKENYKQFGSVKFAQKYKVYTDLYDIVHSDGVVDAAEESALKLLKEVIDINAQVAHSK